MDVQQASNKGQLIGEIVQRCFPILLHEANHSACPIVSRACFSINKFLLSLQSWNKEAVTRHVCCLNATALQMFSCGSPSKSVARAFSHKD